jgi:CRP-like cAMP-binding protein
MCGSRGGENAAATHPGHRQLCLGDAPPETTLVDEGPTSARVEAIADVVAFAWPLDRLRRHLATHEGTALRVLRVISRTLSVRLREANRLVAKG